MTADSTEKPLQGDDKKEIDFLKKINTKTKIVKITAGILASVLLIFGFFAWAFAIGSPAYLQDVTITTEIQHPSNGSYLGQEWVVHFKLTNGKALAARTEYIFAKDAQGNEISSGCIIKLYQTQASSWINESDNFTWGYSVQGKAPPAEDYTVTVRLKNKDIVYSMNAEGLFEQQK
ncbi:MAG: hypothetical protein ACK5JF_07005 [Oscillospiraceae bacterium]